jgi:hypothetical protein
MASWVSYISEAVEPDVLDLTWGQLKSAVEAAREMQEEQISAERKAELLKVLGREGFKLAVSFTGPLGGLISASTSVGEAVAKMFNAAAQEPDQKTARNPLLAAMNISDSFQELIDDKLEDKFIKEITPQIEKLAQTAPNQSIPNMDTVIRDWLKRQNIGGSKGNTVQKGA